VAASVTAQKPGPAHKVARRGATANALGAIQRRLQRLPGPIRESDRTTLLAIVASLPVEDAQ
jgi:hypothetical protein